MGGHGGWVRGRALAGPPSRDSSAVLSRSLFQPCEKLYTEHACDGPMRQEAERLIKELDVHAEDVSAVTAWKEEEGAMEHVFSLITTKPMEEDRLEPEPSMEIHVDSIGVDELLAYIPEEMGSTVTLDIELEDLRLPDRIRQDTDIRVTRRTSNQMSSWGSNGPALCFEHWPKGPTSDSPDPEVVNPLLEALSVEYGIELKNSPEKLGNYLVVIEDYRAMVHLHETSEPDLVTQLYEEESTLSEEQLLDLSDGWVIELEDVTREEVDIVSVSKEFDTLMYEEALDTTPSNELTTEEAAELAEEKRFSTAVVVTDQNGTTRYRQPSYTAPGASDLIFRVSKDGVVIDEDSVPIVRGVGFDINVMPQEPPEKSGVLAPSSIFSESEHHVGPPVWQDRISDLGPTIVTNTWVVETSGDYDEVMEEIHNRFSSTVKILDPYLLPDQLSEFVGEADTGAELWILIGHKQRYLESFRSDFEDCVAEADEKGVDLHIRWVPGDNSTPIHDRFVLSPEGGLSIGTSFNSLDSNLSVVYELDDKDAEALERNFDTWWANPGFQEEYDVEGIASTSSDNDSDDHP